MHIIVIANYLSNSRGGLERCLFDICHALSQKGHSISLLYEQEGDQFEEYQKICSSMTKINSYKFKRKKIASSPLNLLADMWKIQAGKNSLVYSSDYSNFFYSYILALFKGIPLVCHAHLPAPDDWNRLRWNNGLRVVKKYITLANVKRYIAVSKQVKSDWATKLSIKEEKINVVYNGIDTELYKPSGQFSLIRKEWNISEDLRIISYVGRLDKQKGLETLIKAFALLRETCTNIRLFIAGKALLHGEEYENSLKQLTTDLGVKEYVEFVGYLNNTTSLYQVSDVTVLPSLWAEPFGRTIIESMACGTPVVASCTGGITEILTGEFNVGLFEPGNERHLSNAIKMIINWRDKDPVLGNRCRKHILENFSLNKTADGIEEVLLSATK